MVKRDFYFCRGCRRKSDKRLTLLLEKHFLEKRDAPPSRVGILHCGDGEIARPFLARGWEVLAFDEDPQSVQAARKKGVFAECVPLETVQGLFDVVFCPYVLGRLGFDEAILKHLISLIASSGFVLVTVPTRKGGGVLEKWPRGTISEQLKRHRLDVLESLDLDSTAWFHRVFSKNDAGEMFLITRRMDEEP